MKLEIPKIEVQHLRKEQRSLYKNLEPTPYGTELANRVANKLMNASDSSNGLYHAHRDYCGLGLFFEDSVFKLTTVNDGYGTDRTVASFDTETDFRTWLARENDQSMSLYGEKFNNQTITKVRLHWYLEDYYSPVWNAYCAYVHSL